MDQSPPDIINVLLVSDPDQGRTERVRAVAPDRLKVVTIPAAAFAGDEGALWPAGRANSPPGGGTREERDAVLRDAHVILLGFPYPTKLRSRTR